MLTVGARYPRLTTKVTNRYTLKIRCNPCHLRQSAIQTNKTAPDQHQIIMNTIHIFISSVQREFAQEREALRDYLRGDPLMRRFFDVFLFEDVPASDRRPNSLYLDEVEQSDIYVGLFGDDYGSEDADGISPTEQEFDQATASGVHRLIFRERYKRRQSAPENAGTHP